MCFWLSFTQNICGLLFDIVFLFESDKSVGGRLLLVLLATVSLVCRSVESCSSFCRDTVCSMVKWAMKKSCVSHQKARLCSGINLCFYGYHRYIAQNFGLAEEGFVHSYCFHIQVCIIVFMSVSERSNSPCQSSAIPTVSSWMESSYGSSCTCR